MALKLVIIYRYKKFHKKKGKSKMKRYGDFDTLDELIAYNMPLMREDRKQREERRKARGMESSVDPQDEGKSEEEKKRSEDLLALLYAMEHMSREEVSQLRKNYDEELKEIRAAREAEAKRKAESN